MLANFARRLVFFCAPVLVYLSLTVGLLFFAGEFHPLDEVAQLQAGSQPVLYGIGYRDNFFAYKLIASKLRRAQIMVLGSSRAMQFRSSFFHLDPGAFYNSAGAAQSIFEAHEFIRQLSSEERPEILFLVIDQVWFHPDYLGRSPLERVQRQSDDELLSSPFRALTMANIFLSDLVEGKINVARLLEHQDPVYRVPAIGLNATLRGYGFRNDGSFQYGESILNPETTSTRLSEAYQRIENNIGQFVGGNQLSEASLNELREFLEDCRAWNIEVIGISPPFAPSIIRTMLADGRHTYLEKQIEVIAGLFEAAEFSYYDFTDPSQLGATDEDMLDGFHGSEKVMLEIYLMILEDQPSLLGNYSAPDYLTSLLAAAPDNPFVFFENGFE